MTLAGEQTVAAPPGRVWQLLTEEAALARALPGCEVLERTDEADVYRLTLKLGVGAISGRYSGTVRLSEKQPESQLRLEVSSRGPWGFVEGGGTLELSEQAGATRVRYLGELQVGGMIASVGHRLLQSAAQMIIGQFFRNLSEQAAG